MQNHWSTLSSPPSLTIVTSSSLESPKKQQTNFNTFRTLPPEYLHKLNILFTLLPFSINFTGYPFPHASNTKSPSRPCTTLPLPTHQNSFIAIRTLRSSDTGLLIIPQTRLTTVVGRSFSGMAPRLWNSPSHHLHDCTNIISFKTQLKTHLFNLHFSLAYPSISLPYACFGCLSTLFPSFPFV